jgi:quercetin dioxygenase-like cupin family protein
MPSDELARRDVLQALAAVPLLALPAGPGAAVAQTGPSAVKVDTNGRVAKIKFEAPLAGFLSEINGKYKLRVTELTLAPGGYVGEHNHVGPGIRQVTSGHMTYVLPDKTIVYGRANSSSNPATSITPCSTRRASPTCTSCLKSYPRTTAGHR